MRNERAHSPCHPEEPGLAGRRGTRSLGLTLLVLPLMLSAPACEDLPPAPEPVNVIPVASFIYNPVSPITAGETPVSFNAVGSRDADGSIVSYSWSFGDGTPEQSSAGTTIVHIFTDTPARCLEITYTVLLTVTDDKGEDATASQQVKVIEAPAPGSAACR